jgi:hypothetical protein
MRVHDELVKDELFIYRSAKWSETQARLGRAEPITVLE